MKDRSDDPSHNERTLLPRSYISLPYKCASVNKAVNRSLPGLEVRIVPDSADSLSRGYLEVKRRGVWGDLCLAGFEHTAAQLACTDLGYAWGVTYAPSSHGLKRSRTPKMIQAAEVVCESEARSLKECEFRSDPTEGCTFESQRAGVLCSRGTGKLLLLLLLLLFSGGVDGFCRFFYSSSA